MLDLCSSGWRQGSVLPGSLAEELVSFTPATVDLTERDFVVVVSHDCDVCQPDLSKEPWVDLIVVRTLGRSVDGGLTFGKNPRLLEFDAEVEGRHITGRVSAAERWLAPRERLATSTPSGHLRTSPDNLIASWLGGRYVREAFPDEFNRRCEPIARELRRVLGSRAQDLNAIYLVMDDAELPVGTDYILVMRGTMLDERYRTTDRRNAAQLALDSTAALLSRCEGIDVVEAALVSEAEISLHDVRVMKRWSPFDTLSLPGEEITG